MSGFPEVRFCTSADATRIAYVVMGDGPPLMVAPHGSLAMEQELAEEFGAGYFAALASRFTVVTYDARNIGLSTRTGRLSSLELGMEDLEAVAGAAGLARFALYGNCQLASTAAAYAARHPERVSSLILYAGISDGPKVYRADVHDPLTEMMQANWPIASRMVADMWTPEGDGKLTEELARAFRHSADPDSMVALSRQTRSTRIVELLPEVRTPVLVLHRAGDRITPSSEAGIIARLCRDAELQLLPGAEHWQWLGETERVLDVVFDFLERHAGEAPSGPPVEELTPRQREVLRLVAQGLRNQEIADEMGLSVFTVNRHVSSVLAKLDATSRTEAVHRARELSLL